MGGYRGKQGGVPKLLLNRLKYPKKTYKEKYDRKKEQKQ